VKPQRLLVGLALGLLNLAGGAVVGQGQPEPLPSPLTLEQALAYADQAHPERDLAEAALQKARAERSRVAAEDDLQLDLRTVLSLVEPSGIALDQSHNDSRASLHLYKQLYDFGRTAHALAAADALQQSQSWRLLDVRQQRRLGVMARFFDVLLADLEFARDNEAMSIAYVRLDRARSRHELGQLSDIELLELESTYQQSRRRVNGSQHKQRINRSLLAISLNRPDDLPADLVYPTKIEPYQRQEIELLTREALAHNPVLLALRAEIEAMAQQLEAIAALDNPILRAELEAAAYQRELGGRNPLSASLVLQIPLLSGDRVDSQVAKQRAQLQEYRARLAAYELDLRQELLEHWLELQRLQIRQEELWVTGDYRDLYLERSRTLYDLEIASDLGDSMVQMTDLRLQQAETDFQIRLLRAKLDALAGILLSDNNKTEEEK
jgi:outer membrane protein TolC